MDEAREKPASGTLDEHWRELEAGLVTYLGKMTDPGEGDHLILELVDPEPEDDGAVPYVQFAACDGGTFVRAEVSGNAYLREQYALDAPGCAYLRDAGWEGNDDGDDDERNWFRYTPTDHPGDLAHEVVTVLRSHFGIAHPQLLTYNAWGPAADQADVLGVCATRDVPVDEPHIPMSRETTGPRTTGTRNLIVFPVDRDELVAAVTQVLADLYEEEPQIDDDGDFVLEHMDQYVWVRVRQDIPTIEILARVAHGVSSRRGTAVEVGLLNRDHPWVRWIVRDRAIWQQLSIPGLPFVPQHLTELLDVFLQAMAATRDDLALRTRSTVG